jgi:uncharacterized RDD family membrane protein YckC
MTFDDRISISTPEGLDIELNLAGLGSRIAASLVDAIILGILLVLTAFGVFGLADRFASPLLAIGIGWLVAMLLTIGYFIVFEVFNRGRTPGKAMFSIRVLGVDGDPVGFGPSVVRNLLRLVDLFPLLPVLGPIAILVSDRNQRVGDLAARTIVVRDRPAAPVDTSTPAVEPDAATWDVSALGDTDVDLARRFLSRRGDLTPAKRAELAAGIAGRIRDKVPTVGRDATDEWVIEQAVAVKLDRRQR